MIVNVDSYRYEPYQHPLDTHLGIPKPKPVEFSSALDAAEYLSSDYDFASALQNVITTKFHNCSNYAKLKKNYSRLNTIPSFRFYRKKNQIFNDNVRRFEQNQPVRTSFREHILGLASEIQSSQTTVMAGQKLFYGLGKEQFDELQRQGYLPYFLSTTFSLVVAAEHSVRKTSMDASYNMTSVPVVIILTLEEDYKALFAPKGSPNEYELLFNRNAKINVNSVTKPSNGRFQIAIANLVGFK
ncbi:ADP-ribosyltransferase family protein [Kordiimonas aquimaris]|uniref:hypothetical protein n=1 Tax=Kordiimonas aquimaris TaxID=707591 RepID=UPI0021D2D31F|nr:hypothetical protein [Kordiimonas aquimaris]